MSTPVKIAVIGAGRIGSLHTELLSARVNGVEVVAVADVVSKAAESLAERFEIPVVCSTVDEAIDRGKPDALLVCSSTDTHEEAIEKAASRGVHVFCEKPLSDTIESIERIRAAVERSAILLQVGFNRRFDASFARVRQAIAGGEIGELHTVRITSRDPEPPPIEYVKRSGGLFMDMTIHDFDMVRFLCGAEPTEVYAIGECRVDPAIREAGDIDTALVTLRFADGTFATIENSRQAVYGYDQRAEAFGSAGAVSTDNVYPNTATLSHAGGVGRDLPLRFFLERYTDSYVNELSAFVGAVRDGAGSTVDVIDGREAVFLAQAAERSRKSGAPVVLADYRAELEMSG